MKKLLSLIFGIVLVTPVFVQAQTVIPTFSNTDNTSQTPTTLQGQSNFINNTGNGANTTGGAANTTGNPPNTTGGGAQPTVMSSIPNPLSGVNSISDLIYKVVQVVVDISYVVVAFFLLLSGFKFVTAQGSETKLEDAKRTFFYTIIGAGLVIGAQVIVSILQGIFNSLK